jgi:hypothetical protein
MNIPHNRMEVKAQVQAMPLTLRISDVRRSRILDLCNLLKDHPDQCMPELELLRELGRDLLASSAIEDAIRLGKVARRGKNIFLLP